MNFIDGKIYQLLDADGENYGLLGVRSQLVMETQMDYEVEAIVQEVAEMELLEDQDEFDLIIERLEDKGYMAQRVFVEPINMF